MSKPTWWETLIPWLDAVAISTGGTRWTGFQPDEGRIDLQSSEGPIQVRSVSGGNGPFCRRTLAGCGEYLLDLLFVADLAPREVRWTLEAPVLRPIQPPTFPRPGVALPLESRWIVEWKTIAGPKVRTSGESSHSTEAFHDHLEGERVNVWAIARHGMQLFYLTCHEPSRKARVQTASGLMQDGRYTVRVTGDGFFDYWMLDPEHTPAPLHIGEEEIEVGVGWGFVRLEHGRETTYGSLRQDWGLA